MNSFQLVGIDPTPFEPWFELSNDELRAHHAVRQFAHESPGLPCRVSLKDAEVGAELLLVPFAHHEVDSPYRASGPIYVRRGARPSQLAVGEVPPYVTRRQISLRAYDRAHMMIKGLVVEGPQVDSAIEAAFGDAEVAYIHLHNARRGCFSCRVNRA